MNKRKQRNRHWDATDIAYIAMTFCYLFYFKIYRVPILSFFDSAIIIGIVLFSMLPFVKGYLNNVYKVISYKKVLLLLLVCFGIIFYAMLLPILKGSLDFSTTVTLIHLFIFVCIGILLFAFLKTKQRADKIFEYIILCFVIQTGIQYAGFLIPSFGKFTNIFKSDYVIELKKAYDGFRLNAVAGSFAFGLAVAYSIATIIFVSRWNELKYFKPITKPVLFLILIMGAVITGRTALLLDAIGIFLIFIRKIFIRTNQKVAGKNLKAFFKVGIVFAVALAMGIAFLYKRPEFQGAFETITVWLEKGPKQYLGIGENDTGYDFFSTNYSVISEIKDILFGDGIWENSDGTYYLHQDAGYVRILGFGGFVWLVILFIFQLFFFNFGIKKKRTYENVILLFVILVATLKGDNIGISLDNNVIILLVMLCDLDLKGEQYAKSNRKQRTESVGASDCVQSVKREKHD